MMYAQFKPAYQVRQVDVLAAVYEGLPIRLGRLKSCKQCNAISSKQCNAISSKQDDKEGRSFSFKRKGKEGDLRIERRKREKIHTLILTSSSLARGRSLLYRPISFNISVCLHCLAKVVRVQLLHMYVTRTTSLKG